jgi:flagellar hook protein FlgE
MSIMNASVSGMMADSNWLSTISQNVANANTTGYKTVETEFAALVDQVATSAQDVSGVTTSLRYMNAVQGTVAATSTVTDLAVQGGGYFAVTDSSGALYLTRSGSFVPDALGNLVNPAGYYLMGYRAQAGQGASPTNAPSALQKVNVVSTGEAATPTTSGALAVNLPATAAAVAAANLPVTNSSGATYTDKTSLVAYDNLGGAHTIDIYFTKTGTNTWEFDAYDASNAAAGGGFPYSSGPLTTKTLAFSAANGALTTGSPVSIAVPGGQTMSLDLGQSTQLAAGFNVSTATANGNAPSSLTGIAISSTGVLSFNYSNRSTSPAWDIPLANVESPDAMRSVNGDAFEANYGSGPMRLGTPGSGGFGSLVSSALEGSTTDLATELTNMIQAQSSYQANSKAFQTGANILDVLNGLKI